VAPAFLLVLTTCADSGGPPEGDKPRGLTWDGSDMSCPSYNPALFDTDLTSTAATSTAGTIAGDFAVTDAGAASYRMKLEVPVGRAGMQPELAIEYNSDRGNGVLGVGFALTGGVSAITLCPRNVSEDGVVQAIQLDGKDPLCLDGQRLVAVNGGAYGAIGTEYRTVPDSFTRIVSMPSQTEPNEPKAQWFRVWHKGGRISDYGTSTGSTIPVGNAVNTIWNREKVTDLNGNYMLYRFGTIRQSATQSPAIVEQWLQSIDYTFHTKPALDFQRRVEFRYATVRPDPIGGFNMGSESRTTRRLSEIWMRGPGPNGIRLNLIRWYRTVYQVGAATGRSRLVSLQECTGSTAMPTCKTPTRFTWQGVGGTAADRSVLGFTPGESHAFAAVPAWRPSVPFTTGDFNGDGREDLLFLDYGPPGMGGSSGGTWRTALAETGPLGEPAPADPILERTPIYGTPNLVGVGSNRFQEGFAVDYDQDGLTDLLTVAQPTYMVHRSTGTGFSAAIDTGIPSTYTPTLNQTAAFARFIDFTGDGAPDLVDCLDGPQGGYIVYPWQPARNNVGPGWGPMVKVSKGTDCQSYHFFISMDADGDGAADLLVRDGSNYRIYFGTADPASGIRSIDSGLPELAAHKVLDVNGDGYEDLIGLRSVRGEVFINTGGWANEQAPRFKPGQDMVSGGVLVDLPQLKAATVVDMNGDGRDDIMLGAPHGFYLSKGAQMEGISFASISQNVNLRRVAINGDPNGGLVADFAPDEPSVAPHTFGLYHNKVQSPDLVLSISDGLSGANTNQASNSERVGIVYEPLIDEVTSTPNLDFYHRADHSNCRYPTKCVAGTKRVVRLYHVDTGQGPDNVRRGFFAETYRDARFDRLGRGWLGFARRTEYHLTLRNKLGSADRAKRFYVDYTSYDPVKKRYPRLGAHSRVTTLVGDVTSPMATCQMSSTVNKGWTTYGDSVNGDPVGNGDTYFDYVSAWEESFAEGVLCLDVAPGRTVTLTRNSTRLNAVGDTETLLQSNDDSQPVDLTVNTQYSPNAWIVPVERSTVSCSAEPVSRLCRRTFEQFDPQTGMPTTTIVEPDDPLARLETTYFTDSFGHITGVRQTGAGDVEGHPETRVACTSFETNEQIFPFARQKGGFGFEVMTWIEKYDPALGLRKQLKDQNGLFTRWAYDGFGNPTRQRLPDGTTFTTTTKIVRDGALDKSDLAIHVRTTSSSGDDREVQLDTLGRLQRAYRFVPTAAGGGPRRVVEETRYDELGRVVARSLPAFDSETTRKFVEVTYDGWNRLESHKAVDGTVTTYTHRGRETDIVEAANTPQARTTRLSRDGLGRVTIVADASFKFSRFKYGPFNTLFQTSEPADLATPPAWGTTIASDAYGRPLAFTDPDRGVTTNSYNAFGELVQSVDANQRAAGTSTVIRHDGLGRKMQRLDQDGTTAWSYDNAPGAGVGQLASTESSNSWRVFLSYDGAGRPIKTRTVDPEGNSYDVGRSYDSAGRLFQLDYPGWTTGQGPDGDGDGIPDPNPFAVQYGYDTKGNLTAIWDAFSDAANRRFYWRLVEADAAGRNFRELLGDGITTVRIFDDGKDGAISRIVTQKVNSTFQDLVYSYDAFRNLSSRTDRLQNGIQEKFCYDKMDRITGSVVGTGDPCAAANIRYRYSPNGNLLGKADLGADNYAYHFDHPHAVQFAGSFFFDYDAKGNQTLRFDGNRLTRVSYNASDKPILYSEGDSEIASIEYDADQNRVRKQTRDDRTIYVSDLFEKVTRFDDPTNNTVDFRYFIHSPERTVAVVTLHTKVSPAQLTGQDTHYLYVDHLGSLDVITDQNATVKERRSYDAFGQRRSPVWTQTGGVVPFSAMTRDFTGHEYDDELGLVNMKGRLYDPVVGRFTAADPMIKNPANGQSWNRYSYVLNSPLKFTDPTGYQQQPAPPPPPPPPPIPTCPPMPAGTSAEHQAQWDEVWRKIHSPHAKDPTYVEKEQTESSKTTAEQEDGGTNPGTPEPKVSGPLAGFKGSHGGDSRNPGGPGSSGPQGAGGAGGSGFPSGGPGGPSAFEQLQRIVGWHELAGEAYHFYHFYKTLPYYKIYADMDRFFAALGGLPPSSPKSIFGNGRIAWTAVQVKPSFLGKLGSYAGTLGLVFNGINLAGALANDNLGDAIVAGASIVSEGAGYFGPYGFAFDLGFDAGAFISEEIIDRSPTLHQWHITVGGWIVNGLGIPVDRGARVNPH
jgi:RHS repeat-associated protein